MGKRVQSPSSIKTYKQCPRKYYYNYIEKRPQIPNIHQVRGNIAHSVLENFFDINTTQIDLGDYRQKLKLVVQEGLVKEWHNYKGKLEEVGLEKQQELQYFEETLFMLFNWLEQFFDKVDEEEGSFTQRFRKLTPERELEYRSEKLMVRGFIDAIENRNGTIRVMDYKTNKSFKIRDHTLQLAIYSLLYLEKHGEMPHQVGIYFLKDKEQVMNVDKKLVDLARKEVSAIHLLTKTDHVDDYPRRVTPLCKWSTGQCEHYDVCNPHQ
jgi:CRISPR/Cas system-associated exonuclease Cas4 (RecB family)